jgi:hypothetical protein
MKFHFLNEPELEFGAGKHVCPRAGITNLGVYDLRLTDRREKIFVGAVGTNETLEKLKDWLLKCSSYISAKPDAAQPNLFPAFCGFNPESGFRATLAQDSRIARSLRNADIEKILAIEDWNQRVETAVNIYYDQIKFLAQNRTVDVIVCVIPDVLYDCVTKETPKPLEENLQSIEAEESEDFLESNLRRALKAKAMHLAVPLQLIREISFEATVKEQQDEATKAWNFCTALYYKANRQTVPWRLMTDVNKPSACFVGISFYRSRDRKTLHTSLAQVFDELGNGVILRGTPVEIDKQDRRPHLTEGQAFALLKKALEEYQIALNTVPGRMVLHKSSLFNDAEVRGFENAAADMRVQSTDFVTILDSDFRLFRKGIYPPYRGSQVELDKKTHVLYTRGSVKYYRTQTSLYIPQPL